MLYNNENYIGNHIDNVWFSQQIPPASSEAPYFTLTKHVLGLTAAAIRKADLYGSKVQ